MLENLDAGIINELQQLALQNATVSDILYYLIEKTGLKSDSRM